MKINFTMQGVAVFVVATLVFNTHGQKNKERDSKIHWTIKLYPIVFGQDALLFCNLSSTHHCCTNDVTWMKESYVILHCGASKNSSKYQQISEKDGFTLVIKHFDEKDINCQYTCLYGSHTYSSILRINTNDFELLPTNETATYKIHATQLVVDVNFGKVFPSPQCEIMMNERILQSKIVANETSNGLFLSSHIKLICDLQSDICSGNTSVQCLVGKTRVINTPIMPACKNGDATLTANGNEIIEVVLGITVFLAVCFSIALPVIIYMKKRNSRHNCCADLEGNEMYNLLPVKKGSECSLKIISECVDNRYWLPFRRSKDVIKLLQVAVCDGLYLQLAATNLRINQIRNKIWMVIVEYASDMCPSIRKKIMYSRKSSDIKIIIKHTITTYDKNMLLTACNIKINEARMKRNELDSLLPVGSNNNRTHVDVLQKMAAENRMDIANNNVKETINGASCCIQKTLHAKKDRDILLPVIHFAIRDRNNMLVTASNSRIDHARHLLWKEKNQLDSLVPIDSMYYRINVDVLQKMTGNHMDTTDNSVKEKSSTGKNGPPISMFNRIKHDRDLIIAQATFKKTNSSYCLLMASNMRINKARLKSSKTEKRIKYE